MQESHLSRVTSFRNHIPRVKLEGREEREVLCEPLERREAPCASAYYISRARRAAIGRETQALRASFARPAVVFLDAFVCALRGGDAPGAFPLQEAGTQGKHEGAHCFCFALFDVWMSNAPKKDFLHALSRLAPSLLRRTGWPHRGAILAR
eukprot:scaffold7052_cov254-Pinguiococcus_pyrenoidosus.AAC.110